MSEKCGAKTRSGGTCQNSAMQNGRCRMHGGTNPGPAKGSQHALKHGIYSTALTDDEKELWGDIEIGNLDNELRMVRIQYLRALKGGVEHADRAERLAARIGTLEKTRHEISGDSGGGEGEEVGEEFL